MTKITVGSDPEMVLLNRRRVASPLNVENRQFNVGMDVGNVELRPQYSEDVQVHVNHIHNALQSIADSLRDRPHMHLRAGSGVRSHVTGGHIHLGMGHQTYPERNYLAKALDYVVGIPLLLQCDPQGVERRMHYGYGRFGSWRAQPHGVEYRTPASWLVDPKSTTAALALAKVVVDSTSIPAIVCDLEHLESVRYIYTNRAIQLQMFETTKRLLDRLDAYPAYKSLIDPLFKRIERGKHWWENRDVLINWKLRPTESYRRYRPT